MGLRTAALKVASNLPKGDPTRRKLLAALASTKEAKEFGTEDALKQYLKEHPGADPSAHTVSKGEGDSGGDEESSGEAFPSKKGQFSAAWPEMNLPKIPKGKGSKQLQNSLNGVLTTALREVTPKGAKKSKPSTKSLNKRVKQVEGLISAMDKAGGDHSKLSRKQQMDLKDFVAVTGSKKPSKDEMQAVAKGVKQFIQENSSNGKKMDFELGAGRI